MISNVLFLTLLASAAVAQPTNVSGERHRSKAVAKDASSPPSSPKSAHFGRSAPLRRSSGLDAIGAPDSINNVLSIPILSSVTGDNSRSTSLLGLKERGLLDNLNIGGEQSKSKQTTTNLVGNDNGVLVSSGDDDDGLLDLGNVNILGTQSTSESTTTNVQGQRNKVNSLSGNSRSGSLLGLKERDLLDDLDLNLLGHASSNEQTTTNVAGDDNDVFVMSGHKRSLLDLGNVNVLGTQSESTTTTTNVQGNGNNVNVNSQNNNKNTRIENTANTNTNRKNQVNTYYDDEDYECSSGSNRGRSGGQRRVKAQPTHTQRAVKQRKEASRSKVAKKATSTWKPTHRPTNNYAAAACTTSTVTSYVTKWRQNDVTKWRQAAASTVTATSTVTKWGTKTVTRELAVAATPTPTHEKSHLLDLDLDAKVGNIVSAVSDLKILRERE
ncbi:hypothetical protein JCM10212_006656 [Sporobolomyces blumeae]